MKREGKSLGDPGNVVPVGSLECALVSEAHAGRIPCSAIFRVAAAQGVPVAEAGRAVQRLRIKVSGCQMGCF